MGLEQIIPAIFLIAVLILVLPSFIKSNSKSRQFFQNLFRINLHHNRGVNTNTLQQTDIFKYRIDNVNISAKWKWREIWIRIQKFRN